MATRGREKGERRREAEYGLIHGNTVRAGQGGAQRYRLEAAPAPKLSHTTRKNRDKARHMNMGYVLFLSMALLFSGIILSNYLGLQADITNSIANIADLKQELNNLRMANDDEYNRIANSIDLEEIRQIAIQELGMIYAQEGQIVDYAGSRDDYVRQIAAIPD